MSDIPAEVSYPQSVAVTRHFTHGAPKSFTISADGEKVLFLRSASGRDRLLQLWLYTTASDVETLLVDPSCFNSDTQLSAAEQALRERLRESRTGIVSYSCTPDLSTIVFSVAGSLYRCCLDEAGSITHLHQVDVPGPIMDPRIDPTGRTIACVIDDGLYVIDEHDQIKLLVQEPGVTWGLADHISAEELAQYRGFWWSPDGDRLLALRVDTSAITPITIANPSHPTRPARSMPYPFAGGPNPDATLAFVDLDGTILRVSDGQKSFEYLPYVSWSDHNRPLIAVMNRAQNQLQIMSVDSATGTLEILTEAKNSTWLELIHGTPYRSADGQLVTGTYHTPVPGLAVSGRAFTPPHLYVRSVVGEYQGALMVSGTDGNPAQNKIWLLPFPHGADSPELPVCLTPESGWFTATTNGDTCVITHLSLDHHGSISTIHSAHGQHVVDSFSEIPPFIPVPIVSRTTSRQLPTGVVYPRWYQPGQQLPVLMCPYAGPSHQEVIFARAAWLDAQWWADQGFAVVTVDGRGTPGITCEFEREIWHDLATSVLDDQVDALHAVSADHKDLDLTRVGIMGWSFGGYLAALAVLRRPDVFHAAIAGAPVTDWELYDTCYTERFLGLPKDNPDGYRTSSLLHEFSTPHRPLMLIHGLADDNVLAAHSLRLSSALLTHGYTHHVLPLTDVTHSPTDPVVAENLLLSQLDFFRMHLMQK